MRFVREHFIGLIVGAIAYELYYRSHASKGGGQQ